MASVTSSSRRSSSSWSSSRYSTSSSYRSEGSLGGPSDPLDPLFEPFLDSADHSGLFGDGGPGAPGCLAPFRRPSYGQSGAVPGWQSSVEGGVRLVGDCYVTSADVSRFEPHDVAVAAYKRHVVIHAQKVLDDGSVSDTFTHRSLFPEDMDPLSVSGTLGSDGTLVVSVRRVTAVGGEDALLVPTFHSEAHLSPQAS
ncbi:heat shock protein beta-7-like [Betta splendens]|uniref:Heat shock protein beta-7-like n=1 Tax=Betta splendens TaxID=158456 RepID=A0A9W2Y718_BETSP|nr:heat shock protein beta-7-like [Betta splendens]